MRILVVSNLYPPVAVGGYEVECSSVVDRLREHHDVLVLTSSEGTAGIPPQPDVRRELAWLSQDSRGALAAPYASLRAVRSAHLALAFAPEMIYVWNGASIPQAGLRVLADSGLPLAFRVCEHWFGHMFRHDQFMRELLPAQRAPGRAAWAAACRAFNRLPSLRLDPLAPLRTAVSWNSAALERTVALPSFVDAVLERVGHPVPRHGEVYSATQRAPALQPQIVFLGRITPYKGLVVAIEALALLRTEHGIAARLIAIGPEDAAHGAELRGRAAQLGVAGQIDWRGQLTPQQVAAEFARAHALIVPSVWDEPFGLVTIEGALARVPIVASDVGGISEGMHDEEHALLFPRADAAAAATALARTLRETEETVARVARAYERAEKFRIGPYLDAQERFVADAYEALTAVKRDGQRR